MKNQTEIELKFLVPRGARTALANEMARGAGLREVVGHMLGGDRVLRYTVLALALWGLTTYYAVWLLQRYWNASALMMLVR